MKLTQQQLEAHLWGAANHPSWNRNLEIDIEDKHNPLVKRQPIRGSNG
jgi:hypothetical protein